MRELVFLRHGVTDWNREKRLQGRRDVPLSAAGHEALRALQLPPCWAGGDWHVSPLARTVASARALGALAPRREGLLVETDWGEWEGFRLPELRARLGESMRRNEARGLDFRPPGGESPRDVRTRLARWLAGLDRAGGVLLVMTHKGVIRAALSLATGWDMRAEFRPRPDWSRAQLFHLEDDGSLTLAQVNVALEPRR